MPSSSALPVLQDEESGAFWQRDWVIAGAAVAASLVLLWLAFDRRDIAHRWPATEAIYESVGLHIYHPGEGLSLLQVRSEIRDESGATQLVVEGQIHNDTAIPQSIPNILAAAMGPDGKAIQSWQIDAPAATVAPGESVPFTSDIRAPKGTVVEINMNFIEPGHES